MSSTATAKTAEARPAAANGAAAMASSRGSSNVGVVTTGSSVTSGSSSVTVCLESRNAYVYAACCHRLLALDPRCPQLVATVSGARDPSFCVTLLCDDGCRRPVWHGHPPQRIEYWVERSDAPVATEGKPEMFRRLMLSASDHAVIKAFVEDAIRTFQSRASECCGGNGDGTRDVAVYAWDGEAWFRTGFRRARGLDTLFLPYGVSEDAMDDLTAFLERAPELEALHVSPVRTYMFHGTPGSGKTSLVHCLASTLGYGIATLSFGPGTTDADVVNSLSRLPPRCFLAIEDVDAAFCGRASRNHGVTFGTVLSALDGMHSSAPVAVFLTTNRLFELDAALRRRVDHVVEFHTASCDQIHKMLLAFFPCLDLVEADEELRAVCALARGRASTSTIQKYFVKVRQSPGMKSTAKTDLLRALIECADPDSVNDGGAMYS